MKISRRIIHKDMVELQNWDLVEGIEASGRALNKDAIFIIKYR
jgi:hypothetical protein